MDVGTEGGVVWDDPQNSRLGQLGVVGGGAIHEDRTLRVVLPKRLSWSSSVCFSLVSI